MEDQQSRIQMMMWNRDVREEGEEDEGCVLNVMLKSFYNDIYDPYLDWILMNWIAGLSKGIERSSLVAVLICGKTLVQLDLL
jgi:hypothetical protein